MTLAAPTSFDEDRSLVDEVFRKVGRNVIFIQKIELRLKLLLSYMHPNTSESAPANVVEIEEALSAKLTLGMLSEKLKTALKLKDDAVFNTYMDTVLKQRNELVHHFMQRPDAKLESEEQCRSVIAYLDDQLKFSQSLSTLVDDLSKEFLVVMETWVTEFDEQDTGHMITELARGKELN